MFDARGENQARLAIRGLLDDLLAGRFDEAILVHHRLEFLGHELATTNMQCLDVGLLSAGLRDQRAEKPVADQLPTPISKHTALRMFWGPQIMPDLSR